MQLSNQWTLPIEVPGHGIVFSQRGLEAIPEGAIDYLLEFGYLIHDEKPSSVLQVQEEIKPKRKPKAIELTQPSE